MQGLHTHAIFRNNSDAGLVFEVFGVRKKLVYLWQIIARFGFFTAELIFLLRMHELGTKFIRKKLTSWQENQDNL
jgi:hypothetical protein